MTGKGTLLGTVQYMAPEQLEGKEADHRTDIFAFGVVVYEMVTGQRAFSGESQASLIAAILEHQPVPMSELRPIAPLALDRVAKKCLTKDREDRWQSTRDLTDELRWIADSGQPPSVSAPVVVPDTARTRRMVGVVVAVSMTVAVITGLAVWSLVRPASGLVVRSVISAGESAPLLMNRIAVDVAISRDGQHVAYLTGTLRSARIQVRAVDELVPTTLVSEGTPFSPFFSPDGEWLGFFDNNDAVIKKVSIHGGPTEEICRLPAGGEIGMMLGATWGVDDTIVFGTDAVDSGLWRVSAAGGEPVELTTPDELGDHVFPEMLPGGQAVVFTISRWGAVGTMADTVEDAQLAVVSLEGGEPKVLNLRGSQPRYVPTGHIVYGVDGTLRAVGFDLDRLDVFGNPVAVQEGVNTKESSGAVNFDVSDTGSLLYVGGGSQRTLVWVHRDDGREEPLLGHAPANLAWGRLSPDGTRVAVNLSENGNQDIWVYDVSPATQTRLTFHPAAETNQLWTPDGERVAFWSAREDEPGLYWKLVDSLDPPERLLAASEGVRRILPSAWSADGKALAYWQLQPEPGNSDIGLLSLEGDLQAQLLIAMPFREKAISGFPN